MSRRHRPSEEDLRLWHEVTKSVRPIGETRRARPTETIATEETAEPPRKSGKKAAAKATRPPPLPSWQAPAQRKKPSPAPIDRRTSGRVARGRIDIDERIDLHGMTQNAAHRHLVHFLHDAQARGARMVLVITGKGLKRGEDGFEARGVLRRSVPEWLNSAELRPFVVGYGTAAQHHGGTGALYVQIRRRRG